MIHSSTRNKFALLLVALTAITISFNLACAQKKKKPVKNVASSKNEITITIGGVTTRYANAVNAVIIDGKFMGVINADGSAKVGDSEKLVAKNGSTKTGARIMFTLKGKTMADTGESCSISITYYDGKTIKGTFGADLGPDQQSSEGRVAAVGTFQTNDILKF